MVTLVAPSLNQDRHFPIFDTLVGPMDSLGVDTSQLIELPHIFGKLSQSRGIWHENNVKHDKIEGTIFYDPSFGLAYAAPTASYPDRVILPSLDKYGNKIALSINMGLPLEHSCARWFATADTVSQQAYTHEPSTGQLLTIWKLSAMSKGLSSNGGYRYRITSIAPASGGMYYVKYESTQYFSSSYKEVPDLHNKLSFEDLVSLITSFPVANVTNGSSLVNYYRPDTSPDEVFSPSVASEHIDAIARQLVPDVYPIPDVPYGDLAMKATEKVNANRVNMIAFLRDLRHPAEMVPKLRNLAKLKTLANNYLTIKYGILPTVSDTQTIVAAFKRIGPYIDRNGFSTYSAVSSSSKIIDSNVYLLEQRIKLAIDNEDDEFQALLERLESMGTLPTFQNIWDLIPYSFVVDWFVDVGSFLERIDTRLRLMRLNIRYVTMSRKTTVTGVLHPSVGASYSGTIQWIQYHRWVSDQCPNPPLSLQSTFQDFDHWLESGALLTQRARR